MEISTENHHRASSGGLSSQQILNKEVEGKRKIYASYTTMKIISATSFGNQDNKITASL